MFSSKQKEKGCKEIKSLTNPLNEDELEKKRMADRLRKAASGMNQSCQKKVGLKLKDRNMKRKNLESDIENSTERVQNNCALNVKLDFKNKSKTMMVLQKNLMFICLNYLLRVK